MSVRYLQKVLLVIVCGCAVGINDVGAGQLERGRNIADGNLISTMHWVLHTEVTFDRPVSEIWPVFKDVRRWYTEYTYEDLSGPSYQAGSGLLEDQVLKVTSKVGFPRASSSDDTGGPQYFVVKTIKVVPQKEIVILLSGPAYDFDQCKTQFYVWKMMGTGKRTTIVVDSYGNAGLVKPLSKDKVLEYQDKLSRNFYRSWSEAFANLRKVLDEKH